MLMRMQMVVGGVGASGGSSAEDVECLEVGLRECGFVRGTFTSGAETFTCYRFA